MLRWFTGEYNPIHANFELKFNCALPLAHTGPHQPNPTNDFTWSPRHWALRFPVITRHPMWTTGITQRLVTKSVPSWTRPGIPSEVSNPSGFRPGTSLWIFERNHFFKGRFSFSSNSETYLHTTSSTTSQLMKQPRLVFHIREAIDCCPPPGKPVESNAHTQVLPASVGPPQLETNLMFSPNQKGGLEWCKKYCKQILPLIKANKLHIWRLPKMMVPPKHPKLVISSRKTHGCWVPPF